MQPEGRRSAVSSSNGVWDSRNRTSYIFTPKNLISSGNDAIDFPDSTQSSTSSSQADIARHIALASLVMSSLQQVWMDRCLLLSTKIRVYEILVLPVLLYTCETWTVLAADEQRLEAFHMKCQRQMSQDLLAGPHQELRGCSAHRSRPGVGSHKMPSEFSLWSHRQAF